MLEIALEKFQTNAAYLVLSPTSGLNRICIKKLNFSLGRLFLLGTVEKTVGTVIPTWDGYSYLGRLCLLGTVIPTWDGCS